jgi:hypothetical protein
MTIRNATSTVLAACALLAALLALAATAQAADQHKYESQITEVPESSGVPVTGPLAEVNAMTVDSGHLWLAESDTLDEHDVRYRTDEFNASTDTFESQLAQPSPALPGEPNGVAVGHGTPEPQVYVSYRYGEVGVFSEAGALLGRWTGADTPETAFAEADGVAVDNSLDLDRGDVFVSNCPKNVVDVFEPQAGGKEKYLTQLTGTEPGTPFDCPTKLAVDEANGDLLVVDHNEAAHVDVFEPTIPGEYAFVRKLTGTTEGPFEDAGEMSVAADGGEGNIYVAVGPAGNVVDEFSLTGAFLGQITGSETPAKSFGSVASVAVDPETHRVFVGSHYELLSTGAVEVFGPNLVVPDVTTGSVSSLEPESVTLTGTVNSDEQGTATCEFAWGTTKEFGHTTACSAGIPEGSSAEAVQATVPDLHADTTYWYRLESSNKNGSNPGEQWQDHTFTTSGPGLHGEWASDVSSSSATLATTTDPHNASTSYYFQYGTSANYEAEAPAPPGTSLGFGEGDLQGAQHVQGLSPDTVYHYRVVVLSDIEVAAGKFQTEEFDGPDQTFTTQPRGSSFTLPDNRVWELVSPPDKHGALIQGINRGEGTVQAAANGDAVTYVANAPTEGSPAGNAESTQVFSARGASGWSSQDLTTPHTAANGITGKGEYMLFAESLSSALVEQHGVNATLLSASASELTPYLREEATDSYVPLVTGKEGAADVPPGTEFGGTPAGARVKLEGATSDLSHVVIDSPTALTATAGKGSALYEWSAGVPAVEQLRLVSVLPASEGGGMPHSSVTLGYDFQGIDARGAISNDGSRVFWTETGGGAHLYMRDLAKEPAETLRLDVAQPGATGPTGMDRAVFESANREGTRVLFLDSGLTADSGKEGQDLYECEITEVAGKLACELTDLTPENAEGPAEVSGTTLGASEDGSYVYFVANGVEGDASGVRGGCPILPHAPPPGSECNLYVLHYDGSNWEPARLIARLEGGQYNEGDSSDWQDASGASHAPNFTGRTAGVSSDGKFLAFMSDRSLTGYDNHDAVSGAADAEVFLYDAATGRLACASCNPTGARPHGVQGSLTGDGVGSVAFGITNSATSGRWLAATIPAWTGFNASEAVYQSRYLSNSGRLFFDSSDALVPQDINGTEDVYEYEPPGVGNCTAGASTYGERSGGCVGLISSGTGSGESGFLDASENGDDVFFLTSEPLVPEDTDTAYDVYDAHVCTSSCASAPQPPPACETADACRAAPLAQPSIFGAPSSATFTGAGNLAPPPPATVKPTVATKPHKTVKCAKGKRRIHGKCVKQSRKKSKTAKKASNDRRGH